MQKSKHENNSNENSDLFSDSDIRLEDLADSSPEKEMVFKKVTKSSTEIFDSKQNKISQEQRAVSTPNKLAPVTPSKSKQDALLATKKQESNEVITPRKLQSNDLLTTPRRRNSEIQPIEAKPIPLYTPKKRDSTASILSHADATTNRLTIQTEHSLTSPFNMSPLPTFTRSAVGAATTPLRLSAEALKLKALTESVNESLSKSMLESRIEQVSSTSNLSEDALTTHYLNLAADINKK